MRVRISSSASRVLSRALRAAQHLLLLAGLCLLAWPVFVSAESLWAQYSGSHELARAQSDRRETIVPQKPGSSSRKTLRPGSVLGKLEVPRLELGYVLLEGTDNRTLDKSIGHVAGTGLPGEPGNIGIAGHRNTHFRKLEWIRRGDEIVLTSPRGKSRYLVEWVRLFQPDDIGVLDPAHAPALTIITCFPFEYVGSAPLRYVVRALPDEETRLQLSGGSSKLDSQAGQ